MLVCIGFIPLHSVAFLLDVPATLEGSNCGSNQDGSPQLQYIHVCPVSECMSPDCRVKVGLPAASTGGRANHT